MALNNIRILVCNVLLISAIYSHEKVLAQKVQATKRMPTIESRATGNSDYYVILLSGNGGWRNLVQSLTRYLHLKNISVVGINTKKYLWTEKKPAQIGKDLETLMDQYDQKWGRRKIVFIGFSMGAEVLPFAVNRMGKKYKDQIADLILIGPWQKATFKVKLRDYYIEVNKGADIYNELLQLETQKGYIICDNNQFSICHKNLDGVIDHDLLGGGHHFGGKYLALSRLIGKRLKLE